MKAPFLAVAGSLLLATVASPARSQQRPGIYFSSAELASNQPALAGTVGPLNAPAGCLEVINPATYVVRRLPLAQVWGYATPAGQTYRLVNQQPFAIARRDSLVVYRRQRTIQQGRSTHTITELFYSVGLDGLLRPLTRRGLRQHAAALPAAPPPAPLPLNPT